MRRGNGKDRKKTLRNVNKSAEQDAETQNQSNVDHASEHFNGNLEKRFGESQDDSDFAHPLMERTYQKEEDFEPMFMNKNNNKDSMRSSSDENCNGRSKPEANITLMTSSRPIPFNEQQKFNSTTYTRHNGHSYHQKNSSFANQNSLPPRFQRQRRAENSEFNEHQCYTKRRPSYSSRRSTFYSSRGRNQHQFRPEPNSNDNDQVRSESPQDLSRTSSIPVPNDYSSESENLSDIPSTTENTSNSPALSASVGSPNSSRGIDMIRSLPTPNEILEKLISIFDTVSFSSNEFELLISKIATKHILNKQEIQRLLTATKADQSLERILDETYLNQVKILAVELQAEKNRVLELTKANNDLDHTIRQLQQQQSQTPTPAQYQHMILSFQAQIRRFADENTRLQYQISAYSMMPATINELKQQNQLLSEQLRQTQIRNSALENEAAESERASKNAAEIYKKADSKKQERIEQMIADINKYKKLDKELSNFRQKYQEMETDFQKQIDEVIVERDELRLELEKLKENLQNHQQLQIKYEQLVRNSSNTTREELEKELEDLKLKNDQLTQESWKVAQEINRLKRNEE